MTDIDIHDPSGFVVIADVVPDVIEEIRYHSTYNFVGARIRGYEEPCALFTRPAALALREASDEFVSMGLRIKIFDSYRPQSAVNHFIEWAKDLDDVKMKPIFYPGVDKTTLFDPDGYIAAKSSHSRGSAIDLTLVDMLAGKELDMGAPFDFFGDISHIDYLDLTPAQLENRQKLRDVMVKHGFRPYIGEWWHFYFDNEPYPDTYFDFPVSSRINK